jgi:hypothetical protein
LSKKASRGKSQKDGKARYQEFAQREVKKR